MLSLLKTVDFLTVWLKLMLRFCAFICSFVGFSLALGSVIVLHVKAMLGNVVGGEQFN